MPAPAPCGGSFVLPRCDGNSETRARQIGHVLDEGLVDVNDGQHSIDPPAADTDQIRVGDRFCDQHHPVTALRRILGIDQTGPGAGREPIGVLIVAAQTQQRVRVVVCD